MKEQGLRVTILLTMLLHLRNVHSTTMQSCDSLVYCQGKLLSTVQYDHAQFNDSKKFVDMIQINDPDVTLSNFNALMSATNDNPTDQQVSDFVTQNFKEEGELDDWTPDDYKDNPTFLAKITDSAMRKFAKDLVQIWPKLGRKVRSEVLDHPKRHSIIYIPNGFVIPGGRFKEIYYWDTYWIIEGLLICEMPKTVRGILGNFVSLIQRYGFIPNGSRVYYLNRSQPPLFAMMVGLYIERTKDIKWLEENVQYIEAEMNWWLNNRTVEVDKNGTKYTLARYACISGTPRPESYKEDVVTCTGQFSSKTVESCYKNLKSGAETGWDFSSRWFSFDQTLRSRFLYYTNLYRVVPVDLNAYLCRAFRELAGFYHLLGEHGKATVWLEKSATWQKSIEAVFYDRADGIWYDFDIVSGASRKNFFPSNFAPLWANAYNPDYKQSYGAKAAEYLASMVPSRYAGGIPTSLDQSGEQWDLPNAWPPLQDIVVTGLHNTGHPKAVELAYTYASKWVQANHIGYSRTGEMFEKYDAIQPGQYGGGGEYTVQSGFGWTNGIVISFLNKYPTIPPGASSPSSSSSLVSPWYLVSISLILHTFHLIRTFLW